MTSEFSKLKSPRIVGISSSDSIFVPALKRFQELSGGMVTDLFEGVPCTTHTAHVKTYFPHATIHPGNRLAKGLLPETWDPSLVPEIDQPLLIKCAPIERIFMFMLDFYDLGGTNFSNRERRELYYSVLRFCLYIIKNHKPDIVVFGLVPHTMHDYVLCALCEVFNIKCIFLMQIFIPGYILPFHSIFPGNFKMLSSYENHLKKNLPLQLEGHPQSTKSYFESLHKDYSEARPEHMAVFIDNKRGTFLKQLYTRYLPNPFSKGNYTRAILFHTLEALKEFKAFIFSPIRKFKEYFIDEMSEPFKERNLPYSNTKTTLFKTKWIRFKNHLSQIRLEREYNRCATHVSMNEKFLYFPLHYQPEATTYPMGLHYIDLSIAIRLVSSCLPSDWKIYVKEHYCTFSFGSNRGGSFARDMSYYQELKNIDKVVLVPLETDSFELIDKSQAVATLTGRPGWEAVNRGKPSIVFGSAWYRDCPGTFSVESAEDCKAAVGEILKGHKPDPQKIRAFTNATLENSYIFNIDDNIDLAKLSPEECGRRMAECLMKEYSYLTQTETKPSHLEQKKFSSTWAESAKITTT